MSVQIKHGGELTEQEFRKFTLYSCNSNNALDDKERAKILGFPENIRIAPGAIVRIDNKNIGANTYIGLYSYINGDVNIGENVFIGPHASIVASNHVYSPDADYFSDRSDLKMGKVVIEDGVWLTSGVVITPGCTIGKCALICSNAVVTDNVAPYSIIAGAPAKKIGEIDPASGEYCWIKEDK